MYQRGSNEFLSNMSQELYSNSKRLWWKLYLFGSPHDAVLVINFINVKNYQFFGIFGIFPHFNKSNITFSANWIWPSQPNIKLLDFSDFLQNLFYPSLILKLSLVSDWNSGAKLLSFFMQIRFKLGLQSFAYQIYNVANFSINCSILLLVRFALQKLCKYAHNRIDVTEKVQIYHPCSNNHAPAKSH